MCSGAGKSTLARFLAGRLGAIHIRSDAIRKHLGGVPLARRGPASLYSPAMSERTYGCLQELGLFLAGHGLHVILDAKYDRERLRRDVIVAAEQRHIPVHIVACQAPLPVLQRRLHERPHDISDATPDLLPAQVRTAEAFTPYEAPHVFTVDTIHPWEGRLAAFAAGLETHSASAAPIAPMLSSPWSVLATGPCLSPRGGQATGSPDPDRAADPVGCPSSR